MRMILAINYDIKRSASVPRIRYIHIPGELSRIRIILDNYSQHVLDNNILYRVRIAICIFGDAM